MLLYVVAQVCKSNEHFIKSWKVASQVSLWVVTVPPVIRLKSSNFHAQ